jgi:bud site selection protein 31
LKAVEADHDGMRKNELTWAVTKYHWLRNRYIYECRYKKNKISKELFDFLVRNKVADGALISKWRKRGYEFLCSLLAIDKTSSNFGTVSICRVPLKNRSEEQQILPAVTTGCVSCASCDKGAPIWWDGPFKRSDLMFSDEEESSEDEDEKEEKEDEKVAEGGQTAEEGKAAEKAAGEEKAAETEEKDEGKEPPEKKRRV